jgi:CubicO group peptidase (beta-lactamase class C family)
LTSIIRKEGVMALLPRLQTWLDEAAARHGIPGAAVAVGHGDDLAEAATGVISRDTGVATTPQTLFQIGSVAKVWTATLVMQLVDDGLIDLDQPVRRYLPGFAVVDPEATETVTVRQLLLHTGGFVGDIFTDTGRGDDALDRYLAILPREARQMSPPGVQFSYCNAGFSVLGAMVARLRGGTWESVLRERLVKPLAARHMALLAEEAIPFRTAVGHARKDAHADPTVVTPWQFPRSFGPAGGMPCAAPRDLVRFGRMFLSGGLSAAGERLLSPEALATMTSPQLTLPGAPERGARRRGLGPVLYDWDGAPALGHDGDTLGQGTLWRVLPEHDLVVAMNANLAEYVGFFDGLLDLIVREVAGVALPARSTPPAGSPQPGPKHLAGRYAYPLFTYDVTATDEGFDVTATPHGVAELSGATATTAKYVALTGSTYITARPDNGSHSTLTFVGDGRYLFNGRLAARVPEA